MNINSLAKISLLSGTRPIERNSRLLGRAATHVPKKFESLYFLESLLSRIQRFSKNIQVKCEKVVMAFFACQIFQGVKRTSNVFDGPQLP